MAVSPDLLLKSPSVDARPKAAAAKAAEAPEPNAGGRSSFSEVYARERQSKPVERKDGAAASAREPADEDQPVDETTAASDAEKPAVAESGNSLPAGDEAEGLALDSELDPLLLLGLSGQFPPQEEAVATQASFSFTPGLTQPQAQLQQPTAAVDVLADDGLAALGKVSDSTAPSMKTPLVSELTSSTKDAAITSEDSFAGLLVASAEPEEDAELEVAVGELLEGLDGPKESRQAAEPATSRINPLSQAIAQQIQQAHKPALVPGQPVQMQQAGWSEAVVDRVMWLSSQNLKSAEIQLDPAELGRMEVRIEMSRDQAQITFLSPHAGVRDALEGQMQRLREMFDQQGMSMNVNVSDQSSARGWQGRGEGEAGRNNALAGGASSDDEHPLGVSEIASNRTVGDRGLVDYYA
ncbi:flagellar hook-length control protein FliK [Stutzerimonas stutzeri]|uniref:flagellar hook-length control protein FliK n=1 Tax=Stutzerimonas sp. S1 TaxID=3030652 RepID=UPI0022254455|nr:flagellar hook-length control protein FliK [Stutzerimonas sp. S1]MCW3150307.1 flagellar hook-length control protein FliK [Stutzerimonas sp. S1]